MFHWQTAICCTPLTALLTATRVAALALTALPGSRGMSWRVRLAVALAVTLLVAPTQAPGPAWPGAATAACWAVREAVIGLALGLAAMLLLGAVAAAGELAAQAAGLRGAEASGEDPAQRAPLARMVELTTVALLLASGGHRLVIESLLETFRWMPVGGGGDLPLRRLVELAEVGFRFALGAAAPVVAAAVAARLLTSILARTQPALRDAAAGPSAAALAAAGMWLMTLGATGLLAADQLELLLSEVRSLISASR